MNKKLIALAVAGATLAPAAMAQTANPVTLYGRAYATFESVEATGGTTNSARRNRVSDQASFVGVRGTEDLGGGLKAFFQLEWGYRLDDNGTTTATAVPSPTPASINNTPFSGRNSGVGLQGGFGSIIMGRWDTPMKVTITAVDPFGDLTLGDITAAALNQGNFSRRENNMVQWWSPSWGGFTVRGHYSADEGKTATAKPIVYGASIAYSAGNVYAAYAYEQHKDINGAAVVAGNKEEGNAVAVRVGFGGLRVSGTYGEYKETALTKQKSYTLGFDWTMGKHVVLGLFQNSKDGAAATAAQPECDAFSVGYRYDFTRRTFFITSYTEIKNDVGQLCNFGTGGIGGLAGGSDPKGLMLGVRHLF